MIPTEADDGVDPPKHSWLAFISLALVLPLLYLLSTGPVCWWFIVAHNFGGLIPFEFLAVMYAPWAWFSDHNSTFRAFMLAYLKLFGFPGYI
jgi:hypothetical protein